MRLPFASKASVSSQCLRRVPVTEGALWGARAAAPSPAEEPTLSREELEPWSSSRAWSLASPLPPRSGPIGVLCIQRTLACGRLVGLVTGLGAASSFLTVNQIPIHLGGGLFLIY